jgi:hypothetical protein
MGKTEDRSKCLERTLKTEQHHEVAFRQYRPELHSHGAGFNYPMGLLDEVINPLSIYHHDVVEVLS